MGAFIYCGLICLAPAVGDCVDAEQARHVRRSLVESMIKADSDWELAKSTSAAFSGASKDELLLLLAHPNCGVALTSAWERARRTALEKDAIQIDQREVSRFLGVVEGRLRVRLPTRWEEAIESANYHSPFSMSFSSLELDEALEGKRPWPARPASVVCDKGRCLVTFGYRKWSLPLTDNSISGLISEATVCVLKDRAYVVIYGWPPGHYPVFALRPDNGEVIWSNVLWGGRGPLFGTGIGWHEVELRADGEQVLAFGISGDVVYIEAFDVNTGDNRWRFGTNYLEHEGTAADPEGKTKE